jgi:DNA-binding XRE family transcriptional regulator
MEEVASMMVKAIYVQDAERMMTRAEPTPRGLKVRFADDKEGVIPWEDLGFPADVERVLLPNPYVIELSLEDGQLEEIPWDYARHYADPTYREKAVRAAEEDRRIFGERLKRLRRGKGLSQEELASRAKISRVTIARIELGEQSPRYETIVALAKGLHVPIERLLIDE